MARLPVTPGQTGTFGEEAITHSAIIREEKILGVDESRLFSFGDASST